MNFCGTAPQNIKFIRMGADELNVSRRMYVGFVGNLVSAMIVRGRMRRHCRLLFVSIGDAAGSWCFFADWIDQGGMADFQNHMISPLNCAAKLIRVWITA